MQNQRSKKPIIFICVDQLTNFDTLPEVVKNEMTGIKKWRSRCVSFNNHFCSALPCSPSRSIIYTGKHINVTSVTDNSNNSWQPAMPLPAEGLSTIGSFLRHYEKRYIGKWHLDPTLDRTEYNRPVKTVNGMELLHQYEMGKFNKMGDVCYDIYTGFIADSFLTEYKLPTGTDPNAADEYDTQMDGVLPFLRQHRYQQGPFALFVNYENPHSVKYMQMVNPTSTDINGVSFQYSGEEYQSDDYNKLNKILHGSSSDWNQHHRMFNDIPLSFEASINLAIKQHNNNEHYSPMDTLMWSGQKEILYGFNYFDKESIKSYQRLYFRCLKSVDAELERIYDECVAGGWFNRAVICITSDHGEFMGQHGMVQKASNLYKSATHVPLWISSPELHGNQYIDSITSHIQLMPTLLSLAGVEQSPISIFDRMGHVSNIPYLCANLSIAYGALILPVLRNKKKYILEDYNYIDIPAFSLITAKIIDGSIFYGGYYFSIYDSLRVTQISDSEILSTFSNILENKICFENRFFRGVKLPILISGSLFSIQSLMSSDPLFAAIAIDTYDSEYIYMGCYQSCNIYLNMNHISRLFPTMMEYYKLSKFAESFLTITIHLHESIIPKYNQTQYKFQYSWNITNDPEQLYPLKASFTEKFLEDYMTEAIQFYDFERVKIQTPIHISSSVMSEAMN